jgi:hypothetical protein
VIERAGRCCEYCLIHEDSAGFPHEIDHIVSASIDRSGRTIRFFDPRRDSWDEHFKLHGPVIQPLTPTGEVTARVLRLNAAEEGNDPHPAAGLTQAPIF